VQRGSQISSHHDTASEPPDSGAQSCTSHHCVSCSDEAIPGRVVALLEDGMALAEFPGATEEINVELVDAAPGDLVLVHARIAISRSRREPPAGP